MRCPNQAAHERHWHTVRADNITVAGGYCEGEALVVVRPDWDTYFLAIAATVATRADCTRRKVGCVIVDTEHRIVSTGYNGAPAGQPGCLTAGACPRGRFTLDELPGYMQGNQDFSNCIAVHDAANALLYAQADRLPGSTLYSTDKPCDGCQKLIDEAGITRVVWP